MMSDKSSQNTGPLAVVTGATKGIGLTISEMLLARGCRVIGAYGHDDDAAAAARDKFGAAAVRFMPVKTDLGK